MPSKPAHPDPGTPNSAAAEEAIVNAQRRAEAARLVAQRRLVDLEVVLAGPAAEEWIASLVTEQAVAFEA